MKKSPFFIVAGCLLILLFSLMFFIQQPDLWDLLVIAGWALYIFAIILLVMPFIYFSRQGASKRKFVLTDTTKLVQTGMYAVIRHPQYLGWLLMYVVMMLFKQHWLFILLGGIGIACVIIFAREEDQRMIEKFGLDYEEYMKRVPAMNIFTGLYRQISGK